MTELRSKRSADRSLGISESFRLRADSACFWEAWVASVLARAGLCVIHEPFTIASDVGKKVEEYAQSFDLSVGTFWHDDWCDMQPVEVKSINLGFHSAEKYPFKDVLVCSQKSFLNKFPGMDNTRRHFLFVSRETGSIVWLPYGTKVELGREVMDKSRNETYKVVYAPKSALRDLSDFVEVIRGV